MDDLDSQFGYQSEGTQEHIQVPDELAELGGCAGWGDSLELAAGPDRKKYGEESRTSGLAWASCGMRGWRPTMEDASLMLPSGYIGGAWRSAALFGVFDGHGGEQVARFAVRRLSEALAEMPADDDERALSLAYQRVDHWLRQPAAANELRDLTLPGNEPRDSAETCGTTAVCCLINGSQLVIANAGDSRAVLCKQGTAVPLSEDHKPEVPTETARIEAAGGFVEEAEAFAGMETKTYRVNGNLNLSRALGDFRYKDEKLPAHEQMVSCVPDTKTLTWQVGVDEFVLLACDGVWDCMSSQQAVNFVRARLPSPGAKKGLVSVLADLLDACCANHPKQRGGLGCDNLTAILIRFEDPEAVAGADVEETDEAEKTVSAAQTRRLAAAVSETIQRLAAGSLRRKESDEERKERLAREKEEQEEMEARERKEQAQQEIRKKRREERALLEMSSRKRSRCCAALEEDDEDDDGEDCFA